MLGEDFSTRKIIRVALSLERIGGLEINLYFKT